MKKTDELTNPTSCMSRARPDEITFVLLARDVAAPATIKAWVKERIVKGKNKYDDAQITEALDCADAMEAWRDAEGEASIGAAPTEPQPLSDARTLMLDNQLLLSSIAELKQRVQFLTDARDSLATQARSMRSALNISPEDCGRIMHESWARTKRAQGFHGFDEYKPCCVARSATSDFCPKLHRDLIPWAELPEPQKDINRHAFDDVLSEIRRRAAQFNVHKYADQLSLATEFLVQKNPVVTLRRTFIDAQRPWYLANVDERPWTGDDWMREIRMGENFVRFASVEEAIAYVESHPEVLQPEIASAKP